MTFNFTFSSAGHILSSRTSSSPNLTRQRVLLNGARGVAAAEEYAIPRKQSSVSPARPASARLHPPSQPQSVADSRPSHHPRKRHRTGAHHHQQTWQVFKPDKECDLRREPKQSEVLQSEVRALTAVAWNHSEARGGESASGAAEPRSRRLPLAVSSGVDEARRRAKTSRRCRRMFSLPQLHEPVRLPPRCFHPSRHVGLRLPAAPVLLICVCLFCLLPRLCTCALERFERTLKIGIGLFACSCVTVRSE